MNAWNCQHCGHENPLTRTVCVSCGLVNEELRAKRASKTSIGSRPEVALYRTSFKRDADPGSRSLGVLATVSICIVLGALFGVVELLLPKGGAESGVKYFETRPNASYPSSGIVVGTDREIGVPIVSLSPTPTATPYEQHHFGSPGASPLDIEKSVLDADADVTSKLIDRTITLGVGGTQATPLPAASKAGEPGAATTASSFLDSLVKKGWKRVDHTFFTVDLPPDLKLANRLVVPASELAPEEPDMVSSDPNLARKLSAEFESKDLLMRISLETVGKHIPTDASTKLARAIRRWLTERATNSKAGFSELASPHMAGDAFEKQVLGPMNYKKDALRGRLSEKHWPYWITIKYDHNSSVDFEFWFHYQLSSIERILESLALNTDYVPEEGELELP